MAYQTIKTDGFLITATGSGFVIARAGFGDGYDAAQNIGLERRKWSIKIDVLPDTAGSPLVGSQTRAAYLWDFFTARKSEGNAPFWLKDPKDDLLYLADFADEASSFEILCDHVYGTGLELEQRRMRDQASPITDPGTGIGP